jgi:hypothetical protein
MNLDLTDEETAALLRELDSLIDGDRYFMSPRIKTLKAIRAKIRPRLVNHLLAYRPHARRRPAIVAPSRSDPRRPLRASGQSRPDQASFKPASIRLGLPAA